jgi:hypothetical protein
LITTHLLLACDGCFVGLPAVLSLIIGLAVLVGSIYMLLASNLGARKAYLVLMVSLSAWMAIMSAIWTVGLPGTTPGTGPRGREPQWIPFTPTSEVAKEDFAAEIAKFPNGWQTMTFKNADGTVADRIYPGKIDAKGELETIRALVTDAEARLAKTNGLAATASADWTFRAAGVTAATAEEKKLPPAEVRFLFVRGKVLFGAIIPATSKHPETTVFAYRDKGLVFLYSLYFLFLSLIAFAVHLGLLARLEQREKEERAKLEPALA